ncbi:hypothetical protein ACFOYW_16610 [Gryllotalpicola reticulitermitis]|uniref:Nuclear transport factor 2 family protein n=1 Tax=Gryllotalpicola reticulitermitis TaxID=1184153 RepID=A0ABV8QBZ1_9MICO
MSTDTDIYVDADDLPEEGARQHIADTLATLWRRQTGDDLDDIHHEYLQPLRGDAHGSVTGEDWNSKWSIGEAPFVARVLSRLFPGRTVTLTEIWDDDLGGGERNTYRDGTHICRETKDWVEQPLT